jgi:serine/threonine-protein kinase
MHRDIAGHADQLERFRREARAVAQLNHPHIVQVIDAGEDDGMPYIVFEYVPGETLKERIRRFGRLDIPEALAYAIEISRALAVAHDRGIVHRDVKPQNVLVDEEGSAKVTDFGIARTLDQEGLTADGRVLGTTDYVSPEQALGHAVTGQSDIYSLGIVLYEMLTGEVPFRGENQVAVAMKHVREELPDIQYLRPEVSSALASVLDATTAKDLGVRYQSTHELIRDLEDVLAIETARSGQATGEATQVLRTLPPQSRSRLPLRLRISWKVVAALVALGAIVLAVVLIAAADQTQKGTGAVPNARKSTEPDLSSVSLSSDAANDYDPEGDEIEHGDDTLFAVDRDPNSTWKTETYNTAPELGKAGVGIYLDARPSVAAEQLGVETKTPGFKAEVYGSTEGPPDSIDGWTRLAANAPIENGHRINLDLDGQRYRYYLLWITALPPDEQKVEIAELSLFERKG